MNRKILFYLCLCLIVFLSIAPQNVNSSLLSGMRFTKSGFFLHVSGYFVLTAVACQAFRENHIWFVLSGILILGAGLEIVQYALPTRTFNIYDLLANLAGLTLGSFCFCRHALLWRNVKNVVKKWMYVK